jgi:hypothetical protein
VESLMTPRQDLTNSPLPSPDLTMFVDRSSILDDQGGHQAAYAIVTIEPSSGTDSNLPPPGNNISKG